MVTKSFWSFNSTQIKIIRLDSFQDLAWSFFSTLFSISFSLIVEGKKKEGKEKRYKKKEASLSLVLALPSRAHEMPVPCLRQVRRDRIDPGQAQTGRALVSLSWPMLKITFVRETSRMLIYVPKKKKEEEKKESRYVISLAINQAYSGCQIRFKISGILGPRNMFLKGWSLDDIYFFMRNLARRNQGMFQSKVSQPSNIIADISLFWLEWHSMASASSLPKFLYFKFMCFNLSYHVFSLFPFPYDVKQRSNLFSS